MEGALLVAACSVVLVWVAGSIYLNRHYYRDVRDLRDNLRKTYPNPAWATMSHTERRAAYPFDARGAAIFEETRAALRLRRSRAQAMLAGLGILALCALMVMARASLGL